MAAISALSAAAIETGRREISLDEAVRLPWIYGVELADLVPRHTQVGLGATSASGSLVQAALRGKALTQGFGTWGEGATDLSGRLMRRVIGSQQVGRIWPDAPPEEIEVAARSAANEVEVRAAKRLGIEPVALALAAQRRWGHGLSEERDRRAPHGITSRRHITRALLDELRPDLEAAGLLKKGR